MNKNILRTILIFCIVFLMATIFKFSSQNGVESSEVSQGVVGVIIENIIPEVGEFQGEVREEFLSNFETLIRKLTHFSIYAILGMLSIGLLLTYNIDVKKQILIAFFICAFYACTDEFHQLFVDGRSGEFRDVCIDSLGAFTGIMIVFGIYKFIMYFRLKSHGNKVL